MNDNPIHRVVPQAAIQRIQFGSDAARLTKAAALHAVEQRRAEIGRVQDTTVKLHRNTGFVTVQDPGEVALDVNFPIWFVERPGMAFGGELAEGHSAEETNFPTVSVVVLRWITKTRGDLSTWWTGATLGIVTTGREGHKMVVHWHAEGKAMVNPLNTSGDADGSI